MTNDEHPTEVSQRWELLWDLGGQVVFEAIGEACWVVVLIVGAASILALIYRAWFCSERYRLDEKVV